MAGVLSWAARTPAGDARATLAALIRGEVFAGQLAGELVPEWLALAREVLGELTCDVVLIASTKGDLPVWAEAVVAEPLRLAGGLAELAARVGQALATPTYVVSAACASGPIALAEAARLIRGGAQRVLVLGGDRLAPFVEAGFAGLGALAPAGCRPFDRAPTGIALGETLSAVLLGRAPGAAGWWLQGWGQTLDAVHLTAPARDGAGLARAARAACAGAQPGLIIAHGTGTAANDRAELSAYAREWPDVPLTAWKGGTGHSLGACGVTEVALALTALTENSGAPGVVGLTQPDGAALLPVGAHHCPAPWLSPNAGFGGLNGAVLIGRVAPPALIAPGVPRMIVRITGTDLPGTRATGCLPRPTAREVFGVSDPTWGRLDAASRLMVALGHALAGAEWPAETGVVLLTDHGCCASDARFERARRAQQPEFQTFAYTLPSAPIGEASIRLHLTGPGQVLLGASDVQGRHSCARLLAEGCPAVLLARIETGGVTELAWAERWHLDLS